MKAILRGSYLLVLQLNQDAVLEVGRLRSIQFKKGIYIYAGSAQSGLEARLRRHFSKGKKLHWHIDYLTEIGDPLFALIFLGESDKECLLNQNVHGLPGSIEIRGFGCSDCQCTSHLHIVDEGSLRSLQREYSRSSRYSRKSWKEEKKQ